MSPPYYVFGNLSVLSIYSEVLATGNTLGFLVYHLATNPEKQEKLRKECQSVGKKLNVKSLNELRYLKACIQETNRLTPTNAMFARYGYTGCGVFKGGIQN